MAGYHQSGSAVNNGTVVDAKSHNKHPSSSSSSSLAAAAAAALYPAVGT